MADEKKTSGSDTLGIIFKNPKPKPDESATSPMAELYGRSLSSISDPNKKDIRTFNLENAFSEKTLEEGTIVSDRRKDRPGFLKNVGLAFSEWQHKILHSFQKENTNNDTNKKYGTETREKKTTTVTPSSPTKDATPPIEKMRVMQHDLDAHTAATTVPKRDSVSGLQKMRTFKSDAALLQNTPENKKPVPSVSKPKLQPVPQPKEEKAPEPKFEIKKPIKKDAAPQILKKDARLSVPDVRTAMVAPEVSTRLQTDAASFIPGGRKEDSDKKQVVEKNPIRTYVPHIPDTISRRDEESVPKKIESTSTQKNIPLQEVTEVPQWTHTLTNTETVHDQKPNDALPKITPIPQPPIKPAPVLGKSVTPILPHEIRSIESNEPVHETEPDRVVHTAPANLPVVEDVAVTEPATLVKQPRETIVAEVSALKADTRDSLEWGNKTTFHADESARAPVGETKVTFPSTTRSVPTPQMSRGGESNHSLRFMIRMVLTLIGTGTLIVLGAMFFTQEKVTPRVDTNTPTSLVESMGSSTVSVSPQDSRNIMLSENPQVFLTAIARAIGEAPAGLTYLEVYTGEPLRDATAQEFFGHLKTTLMPRAIRALHAEFIIGSITTTKNEPFILIRSDNFDTLFAGLLAWEPSMQQELAPLFGTAQGENTAFTDAVQNNKSIRILRNIDDEETLLYSFINERTVIITTSSDALSKLIGRF